MTLSARPPVPARIAVFGEFSSGKSTLINSLTGSRVLPTRTTATQMPAVWMSYGSGAWTVVGVDGTERPIAPAELYDTPVQGTAHVRVFAEVPLLRDCELIDTPGNSDPNIAAEHWQRMVSKVDGAIWCTAATNAWRQSELAAWKEVPEEIRQNSILVLTRADKLESASDHDKIMRRVTREAGRYFRHIHLVSAIDPASLEELVTDLVAMCRGLAGTAASVAADAAAVPTSRVPTRPILLRPRTPREAAAEAEHGAPVPEADDAAGEPAEQEPVPTVQARRLEPGHWRAERRARRAARRVAVQAPPEGDDDQLSALYRTLELHAGPEEAPDPAAAETAAAAPAADADADDGDADITALLAAQEEAAGPPVEVEDPLARTVTTILAAWDAQRPKAPASAEAPVRSVSADAHRPATEDAEGGATDGTAGARMSEDEAPQAPERSGAGTEPENWFARRLRSTPAPEPEEPAAVEETDAAAALQGILPRRVAARVRDEADLADRRNPVHPAGTPGRASAAWAQMVERTGKFQSMTSDPDFQAFLAKLDRVVARRSDGREGLL